MTAQTALNLATRSLAKLDQPSGEAVLLLAHACKLSPTAIIAHPERVLRLSEQLHFRWYLIRRARGQPLAYITGEREFYGHTFKVTRHTLIPRPDTETIIDEALAVIDKFKLNQMLDIGTGSGCIAISLALSNPKINVIATDTSAHALRTARLNVKRYKLENRIRLVKGHLLDPLQQGQLSRSSLLVANLPYLSSTEISAELKFEPSAALIASEGGLGLYRELLVQIHSLNSKFCPQHILFEAHPPTINGLSNIAKNIFPDCQIQIISDLANKPRILGLSLA